jgi:hypothetical protein
MRLKHSHTIPTLFECDLTYFCVPAYISFQHEIAVSYCCRESPSSRFIKNQLGFYCFLNVDIAARLLDKWLLPLSLKRESGTSRNAKPLLAPTENAKRVLPSPPPPLRSEPQQPRQHNNPWCTIRRDFALPKFLHPNFNLKGLVNSLID